MSFCSLILAVLMLEVRSIVGSPTMVQPSTSTISYQKSTVPIPTSATTKLIYSLIANNTNSREATTSDTTVLFTQPKIDTISTNTDTPTTVVTSSTTDNTITTTIITEAMNKHNNLEYIPHKVLTDLEEKIQALSCDIPLFPSESRVWKGNETHELLLPITTPLECRKSNLSASLGISSECTFSTLIWEGSIEIRSGDVLLVRIDDSQLTQSNLIINYEDNQENIERLIQEPQTAVYQVTRTGYDNCDVMEGILLDITPLKVDNRKVVTLYDKDLTEGINLLIVVSELWGKQCIRLKVTVKSDNCGENEDCSGKGICYSNMSMEGYECQCCSGFIGPHCEEQDACYPSPCKNNGICVDISQGHEGSTFQCLCPYGYTGKTCEETTDPCTSMPCQNGATCFGNVTHFSCQCSQGFLGLLCQHNQNECESSPCVHGICVDEQDSYTCYCQPGYTGTLCELEYNECDSSPCLHGGTCTDRIDAYSCACPRGYLGKRCEIKACGTNPCTNGGTCWSSMDSFYCACKPGYTGKTCEDEFVVETIMDTDSISKDTELDLQMPISIHLDHLHNVYIAAGTLASAFVIVALIVTICYCRVNKTYKRFILRIYPFCMPRGRCVQESPTTTNSEWFSGKNKAPTATPSRNLPSLDTTDMYYTLDFSDSQSSPLIQ